ANGASHGRTLYALSDDAPLAFNVRTTHSSVLKLWKSEAAAATPPAPTSDLALRAKTLLQKMVERAAEFLWDLFLPKDAATSVSKDYFPYAKWYFVGSIASAASGVLSMQSLLYAIGLGAGSIPTAAAVNWVLKDGLGQFGGVLFASLVNNRYDADPKRWRTASAVALDAAVLLEILTPLAPAHFLPLASLANVAKNISWLSASATRAGFHNSFALRENLADVTAKAGSQSIASSILGTGLGIGLSHVTGASTAHVLCAFGALSAVHLVSIYRSLSCVSLRTLNCQRLHLVASHFAASGGTHVPSLDAVREREQFVPLLLAGYRSLYRASTVNAHASLAQLCGAAPPELQRLRAFYADERYLLNVAALPAGGARVDLALAEDATSSDALAAHLHAVLVQRALEDAESMAAAAPEWRVVERAYHESRALRRAFVQQLEASEWHTANLLVEEQNCRYRWAE
ncbi:hypothetical protein PybrP1_007165, partial [[Pythium] brassicae (nom. inval.)]